MEARRYPLHLPLQGLSKIAATDALAAAYGSIPASYPQQFGRTRPSAKGHGSDQRATLRGRNSSRAPMAPENRLEFKLAVARRHSRELDQTRAR